LTLHYTSGNNINAQGSFAPAQAGFNLADVSSVDEVNALPSGTKGLVWLDQGDGVTQSFIDAVKPYIGNPNVYGFFLKDEPDPTGQWGTLVSAANLKAESDYIHANVPGAKTFITMMNMGSSDNPTFANTYTPENTHIDLFGIDPYPVRSDASTVDYNMIDKTVAAAVASGIPADKIVPVFQTFGGGNWADDSGGHYVMPTAAQEQQMLSHWAGVIPNPAFDYAYAWGSQNGDQALESSSALQQVFLQHNTSGTVAASGSTAPASSTSGDVAASGSTPPTGTTSADTAASGSTATSGSTSGTTTTADSHQTTDSGSSASSSTGSGGTSTSTTGGSTSTTPVSSTSTDPAASGTQDATGTHHHHGLDFSQLVHADASSWGGHHLASVTSALTTAVTAPTAVSSTAVVEPAHVDASSLFQHTDHQDHHALWHW
jgi:hypothetical protein